MIKPGWLKWAAPVAIVVTLAALAAGILRASGSAQSLTRVLTFAVVLAAVAFVIGAFLWPAIRRRAVLQNRFPDALVRNVRRTASLSSTLGLRAPMRPTLVATRAALALYGGYFRAVPLWEIPWAEVDRIEIGSAREMYLNLESIDFVLRDGRRVVLPIDERLLAVTGARLTKIASVIGQVGRVPVTS